MGNDLGGATVGYFTKIALGLGAIAVVGFDGVAVVLARVSVEEAAQGAATAAASAWDETKDLNQAYTAAARYADEHGAKLNKKKFKVAPDGTVSVQVAKQADTLLLYRTGTTDKWTHVSAEAKGRLG